MGRGGRGFVRLGSFLIEPDGRSVTRLLVYFSGQGNNVPSLRFKRPNLSG